MSGTALPDGSLQAICKVVGKLKQDLCVTAGQTDSNNADAKLILDLERRKQQNADQWIKLDQHLSIPDQKRLNAAYYPLGDYPEKVILFLKSPAGDTFQFNASILAVPQVDSWKLQTIVDIVSDATNPIVLELTQPGFLRDVPKLIAGSVDDPKPGSVKGYLRIEGKQLSGTTAGTFTFPISFTLP
jgi:hypothetical protein